ncbi:DMT family permease [Ahrensia sp. R2A130]|nr:DMT family permease [Ahrensia sp. R2A130]
MGEADGALVFAKPVAPFMSSTSQNSTDRMAAFAPIVFVWLWGTGFVGARLGMPYSEPGTFLTIRFSIACLLLLALAFAMRAKWPDRATILWCVAIGFALHGIYLGGVFWAIDGGMSAGVAAVVVGLQPLLTAVLSGFLLGEVITRRHWLGLAVGIAGVVLVLSPGLDLSAPGITVATVAACAIGMVAATLGTLGQKRFAGGVDLRVATALQYAGATIPVALLMAFTETREVKWSGEMIVALVWSIFVLSFGAVFLLMWLINRGSVAKVSTLLYAVPAVAAFMAWLLFDEALTPIQLVGMALCAVGVALGARAASPPRVRT